MNMDEENKINEEINDEPVEEMNSLIDYYRRHAKVDPLSAIKSTIIRQEISFSYEWYINMHMRIDSIDSWAFSTFRCLIQAEPEYYGNYIDMMIEEFKVPEEVIEKVLQHIRSGLIPYQLWINKVISDIKGGGDYFSKQSVESLVFTYLLRTMRTSIIGYMKLYKALLDENNGVPDKVKDMVGAAHIYFSEMPLVLKQEYMDAFTSENETVRHAFQDNELSLFTETLIDMLRHPLNLQAYLDIEKGEAPPFSRFWAEPQLALPPIINRSRGNVDRDKINMERERAGLPQLTGGMLPFDQYLLGYGPNGETPEQMREKLREQLRREGISEAEFFGNGENEDADDEDFNDFEDFDETEEFEEIEFVVEKVAKDSSNRVMSRTTFQTKPEAEDFIKTVTEAAPDMLRSFEFRIVPEKKG